MKKCLSTASSQVASTSTTIQPWSFCPKQTLASPQCSGSASHARVMCVYVSCLRAIHDFHHSHRILGKDHWPPHGRKHNCTEVHFRLSPHVTGSQLHPEGHSWGNRTPSGHLRTQKISAQQLVCPSKCKFWQAVVVYLPLLFSCKVQKELPLSRACMIGNSVWI